MRPVHPAPRHCPRHRLCRRGDGSVLDPVIWKSCCFRRIEIQIYLSLEFGNAKNCLGEMLHRSEDTPSHSMPPCLPLVALQDSAYAKCLLRHLARHGHCSKVLLPWGLIIHQDYQKFVDQSVCLEMGSLQFITSEIGQ